MTTQLDTSVPAGSARAVGVGRRFVLRNASTDRSLVDVILRRERAERRELWALRGVDLEIAPGEAYGIIGRNGSGKSTLLKLLAGIYAPSEGTIAAGGRVGSLLEIGAGFHPEFTGVENVFLSAAVYGIPRSRVVESLPSIIDFAELEGFIDAPVKTYSSGMYTRLGFSVAMHMQPDILLLDEVLAVGDAAFQQKCFARVWEYRRSGGTLVFVSHDPVAVERLCDRAILLEHGRAVAQGTPDEVLHEYHRRLTRRPISSTAAVPRALPAGAACRVVAVRARGGDGAWRERFTEAEPLVIEAVVLSAADASGIDVGLRVRSEDGRTLGGQVLTDIDLVGGDPTPVRLHLPAFPLRDGGCMIDVTVTGADGDVLHEAEGALQLTLIADDPHHAGPVRLGGLWEWPPAQPLPDAASFAPGLNQ